MASGFKIEGSLLLLEVELMETMQEELEFLRRLVDVASIIRSGINGNHQEALVAPSKF